MRKNLKTVAVMKNAYKAGFRYLSIVAPTDLQVGVDMGCTWFYNGQLNALLYSQ